MSKTIHQLKKIRVWSLIFVLVVYFAITLLLFAFKIMGIQTEVLLIFAFGLAVYLINRSYGKSASKRMLFLSSSLMDPETLKIESMDAFAQAGYTWKSKYSKLYYQTAYFSLIGDFASALKSWDEMPAPEQRYAKAKACGKMMVLVRNGEYSEAAEMLSTIMDIGEKDKELASSCQRALGAYYTGIGDLSNGYACLTDALKIAKYDIERLGIHYDLANIEEKKDNLDKAKDHYRQVSALGPKTWMGQEAGRRLEALGTSRVSPLPQTTPIPS